MENSILQVPIEDIIPNRFQPRLAFDDASLADLAKSIKEHGIIQPLVLRRKNDKYEIIAGERRYKAAKIAGLTSVPAIISNLDDNASAEVAIVENIQRKDLSAIEEAKSYQSLLDKGYMTQEDLAKKMGVSQSAISNKLRLLTLDESVQDAVVQEKISERHARTLLKVPSKETQKVLLNKIITERLTIKQLEEEIKKLNGDATPASSSVPNNPPLESIDNIMNSINNLSQPATTLNVATNVTALEEVTPEPEPEPPEVVLDDDIPVITNIPSIENIMNNAVDINTIDSLEPSSNTPAKTVTPSTYFSNPEKMPNKFFNFLEDTAANMNFEEQTPEFDLTEPTDKTDILTKTDNIEMLDDFVIPTAPSSNVILENDYLDYVIKTIRELNLDKDKVVIEEMNLPTEYHINIKIKKDKI